MTTPAMPELPEPELGYIQTDKSKQPAFSAAQIRAALQSAQPAGHSCVFHAAPLTPGDTRCPQFAVCAICGQPPRVLASQTAAAVSDDDIYDVWTQHCQTPGTTTRQLVCGFARAIPALSPQAVPMTDEQIAALVLEANVAPVETPAQAMTWIVRAVEARHGITQRADGGEAS